MNKFVVASIVATGLFCAPASAADMPVKALRTAPAFDWSGFYAGANAGYAWGSRDQVTTDPTGAVVGAGTVKPNGWLGGVQAGYNWMMTPSWLVGAEADFSLSTFTDNDNSPVATGNSRQTWFATARGRLGYVSNNWLLYGTGGAAWSQFTATRTITVGPATGETSSPSKTVAGWTLGAGVEMGLAPNWTAKLEYLYMRFPSNGFDFTYSIAGAARHVETSLDVNVVRVGFNYLFNGGSAR